jgi:hypothetical protein
VASTFETLLLAQVAWLQNNTPQLIANQTLVANTPSVTFNNVPAYNNLRLEWRTHLNAGGATDLEMQIDGSAASLYVWSKMESMSTTQSNFHSGAATTFMKVGAASATTANYFSSGSLTIAGWGSSTGYLSFSGTSAFFDTNAVDYIGTYGGLFAATGPHTSLTIFPAGNQFAAGSQFSLYGVN